MAAIWCVRQMMVSNFNGKQQLSHMKWLGSDSDDIHTQTTFHCSSCKNLNKHLKMHPLVSYLHLQPLNAFSTQAITPKHSVYITSQACPINMGLHRQPQHLTDTPPHHIIPGSVTCPPHTISSKSRYSSHMQNMPPRVSAIITHHINTCDESQVVTKNHV